jgi:hypothetical protein
VLERNAADGLHRVEDAFTNWYLVEDAGRLTIVDAAFPRSWALVATGAETVLTGHGAPWRQGVALAVERAREAARA